MLKIGSSSASASILKYLYFLRLEVLVDIFVPAHAENKIDKINKKNGVE
jgi:hypothetical protein